MKRVLMLAALLSVVGCDESTLIPDNIGKINDNKNKIDENEERIGDLENRVYELEGKVSALSDDVDSMQDIVDLIGVDFKKLRAALGAEIRTRVGMDRRLTIRINRVNRRRAQLQRKFQRFERYQYAINKHQAVLNKRVFARILALEKRTNRYFKSLNKKIDNLSIEDISGLSKTLRIISVNLLEMGNTYASMKKDLALTKINVAILLKKVAAINNELGEYGDSIEDIEAAIEAINAAIEELEDHEHENDDDDNNYCGFPTPHLPFFYPCNV